MSVARSAHTSDTERLQNQKAFVRMSKVGAVNGGGSVTPPRGEDEVPFIATASSCVSSSTVWSPESGARDL